MISQYKDIDQISFSTVVHCEIIEANMILEPVNMLTCIYHFKALQDCTQ